MSWHQLNGHGHGTHPPYAQALNRIDAFPFIMLGMGKGAGCRNGLRWRRGRYACSSGCARSLVRVRSLAQPAREESRPVSFNNGPRTPSPYCICFCLRLAGQCRALPLLFSTDDTAYRPSRQDVLWLQPLPCMPGNKADRPRQGMTSIQLRCAFVFMSLQIFALLTLTHRVQRQRLLAPIR
jgi:hypothetical protein